MTVMSAVEVWGVTVPAEPGQLHRARHGLREWLLDVGVGRTTREDAVWSADEAMSDAIANGYQSGTGLTALTLSAHVDDEVVVVTVVDEGQERLSAPSSTLASRGMAIVRVLADQVNLAVADGRTTFTAWFTRA
ncbi:ATP-binding protein [Actinokineospora sp. NBRC 105648]|uniref:ATP-binding protein n=1 Tax=Actinokineospora sp. NBRC 105648 TaxID=3032206 RepID=UPI0024A12E24|nr:ATP-binding protein [Actinokineospora sp. NBRC 105648]GLZ42967.1 hypothetical protein Acsp05_65910 [Actinokineospora sp. NBRC 105648]